MVSSGFGGVGLMRQAIHDLRSGISLMVALLAVSIAPKDERGTMALGLYTHVKKLRGQLGQRL